MQPNDDDRLPRAEILLSCLNGTGGRKNSSLIRKLNFTLCQKDMKKLCQIDVFLDKAS